jgi:hypothetical protein
MARKKVADVLDTVEEVEDDGAVFSEDEVVSESEPVVENMVPDRYSPEWTPYVLSLLTDDERFGDKPRVAGLHRLVGLVIGPFTYEVSDQATNTLLDVIKRDGKELHIYKTSVRHVIKVADQKLGIERTAAGLADSSPYNTPAGFVQYPDAIAETRAKGRAYVNILGIQTVTAEECVDNPTVKMDDQYAERINGKQISAIEVVCKKLDINVKKFLAGYARSLGKSAISEITWDQARDMIKDANALQQKLEEIPDNIRGYNPNWRDGLGIKDE